MIRKTWMPLAALMVLTGCAQQDETAPGLPWWGWLIIILVIFLLFWLVFRSRPEEEVKTPPPAAAKVEPPAAVKDASLEESVPVVEAPLPPDDFTRIEGSVEPPVAVADAPLEESVRAAEMPFETASAPLPPDDLTIIEGIGPKINSILQTAGVKTFAQLAALEPPQIMAILTAGGIRLADATTWPEQAGLAARGEMERLHLYQETLKGGRAA